MTRIIAIDTETTGNDFYHGCRPFMVSACDDAGETTVWEWTVDPFSREVDAPPGDLREVQELLNDRDAEYIFQNPKFDFNALRSIGVKPPRWSQTHDTWIAHHLLASYGPHNLKDMAIRYLDIPDTDEQAMKTATENARDYGMSHDWRVAGPHDPHWPGTKTNRAWWKLDTWMPALLGDVKTTSKYAELDVIRTIGLWMVYHEEILSRDQEHFYLTRRRALEVADHMERRGLHFLSREARRVKRNWRTINKKACRQIQKLSKGKVEDPNKGEKQLKPYLFENLKLPPVKWGKNSPSADKDAVEEWLDPLSKHDIDDHTRKFLHALLDYRQSDKMLGYLHQYTTTTHQGQLHYTFNVPGTKTTRGSSNDPNIQNISKKSKFNLRETFGPKPGRLWAPIDYSNIEMRIFAHASGDPDLIKAFEDGFAVHLIFFEKLYPKETAQCRKEGVSPKNKYKDTLYQWTKNGNFSLIYGAGRKQCNRTYRYPGAYDAIRNNMPYIDDFIHKQDRIVRRDGHVTTLQGYPLEVPASEPHKASNYVVQGTAGWVITEAMIDCYDYLKSLRRKRNYRGYLIAQVHDELIFDLPNTKYTHRVVLPKIKELMELPGENLGFDLPVEVSKTTSTWASAE